jgi:diguanylate cyclase (GGDEF)-like protein
LKVVEQSNQPDNETLLQIIQAQAEIARFGADLGSVMSYVAERCQNLTGAQAAAVELAEQDEMIYRAASGTAAKMLGLRLKRASSLSGLCVKTGQVLRCDDSESDPRVDREACRQVGLRSMVVIPLTHLNTTVGVLKVMASSLSAFSDKDVRVLELMADLIGAAMFHAARNETNELYLRATHDALTGLPNRALFYERLHQSIDSALRANTRLGVLNLDLDGLKPINDTYGHRVGDAAIREAATRIKSAARETDTVARLGGDEFGVILAGLGASEDVERTRGRISERVNSPFEFEGVNIDLGVSIGVAVLPEDGMSAVDLFDCADKAMYATKQRRKAEA